jgi:DhnA family fructose-bisphosphate aldolase class Ia
MPMVMNGGQMTLDSEIASPVLHEEIGHGASGAIVHRCTFATFTAAAKVFIFHVSMIYAPKLNLL